MSKQWYFDCRLVGCERWYWGDRDVNMDIPAEIRKCVGFAQVEAFKPDGVTQYLDTIGTVFFVNKEIGNGQSRPYIVTARHIITGAASKGCKHIYIRSWNKDSAFDLFGEKTETSFKSSTNIDDWQFSEDDTVDAAYLPIHPNSISPKTIGSKIFVEQTDIDTGYVQLGNDVVVTGLFSYHQGSETLEPIVRVGNIAMLPHDKVQSKKYGLMDAYIIEARSIGGLSGSPVFLCQHRIWQDNSTQPDADELDAREGTDPNTLMEWGYRFKFLGLIHGHWDENITVDDLNEDIKSDRVNVGAAVVVPAKHILSMLNKQSEKALDAMLLKAIEVQKATR